MRNATFDEVLIILSGPFVEGIGNQAQPRNIQ